jgi:hypothetical protein
MKITFVHQPKTCGTSIRGWFSDYCQRNPNAHTEQKDAPDKPIIFSLIVDDENPAEHSFTVVRNPWDRAVSMWSHHKRKRHLMLTDPNHINKAPETIEWLMHDFTFTDFVRSVWDPEGGVEPKFTQSVKWIHQQHNWADVDYILKFDRIHQDFDQIRNLLADSTPLPHLNPGQYRSDDYHSYYDQASIDIIARYYAEDIERFGYSFSDQDPYY